MKLTRLITAGVILPFLLALCVVTTGAAASGGTLVATDALEIKQGEDAHVLIFLNGSYEPAVAGIELCVYYDDSVAEVTGFSGNPIAGTGVDIDDLSSGFSPSLANPRGIPTETWLWDITFKANEKDGSSMTIGLVPTVISSKEIPLSDYLSVTSVQNGTFTTKDEEAPVIALSMPTSVSSTFNIAGTITEVGGMGTAKATLKNATATKEYDLKLTRTGSSTYTFDQQVTWPVENDVTLTVTATDAAGNTNTTEPFSLNVVNVGFSDPKPADGSYINAIPDCVQARMTEIKAETVTMYLGSAGSRPIDLKPTTIDNDYVKNTTPLDNLADGKYWVNVSGTGTDSVGGGEWFLNWTFTLDTTTPVINTFTITDSDGDGYIEAGEELTLNWKVTDPNFEYVALVDKEDTDKELWRCGSTEGTEKVVIDVGNRDLEFRAYDKVDNCAKREFHLYNNYMIWVNSTKVGKVSGIDTTYTAAKDLSRIGVSSITLHNGREVPLPTLDSLERTVTRLGQVTPDTHVTVDNTANRKLEGTETYQKAWVYEPGTVLDFTVKVPNTQKAVLVLAEANESYIADLIKGGKGSMRSVDYMELVKKTAYIFIDGGWTEVTIDDKGKVNQGNSSGGAITVPAYDTSVTGVLGHRKNQVDLSGNGYQLGAQGLEAIRLPSGDYALAAITVDDDRIGLLAAMPVVVLEDSNQGSISATSVKLNETFTAKFDTPCERLGVVLLRNNVAYKGTALIDAATLGKDTLRLNITHSGIPATQKLIGNIYVSPNSGKYVVANTNQATVSTTGLDAGTYQVYLAGQSANGTVQAYGAHTLEITSGDVTPTPTPYTPGRSSGGGSGSSYTSYTGTGTLKVGSSGTVLRSIMVNAEDKVGSLFVPIGIKALDKDGNPLTGITLTPISSDEMPAVPSGAAFKFAGYVYEASPEGATFDPGITLTFEIPEDAWRTLDPENNDFTVKWYNKETGQWEDVPTTVYKSTRSVDAEITHFSIFALFTEPATTTTPTETETPATPTEPTTPPAGEAPAEGLPMTMILAIFAVLVIIIAAGYFFMVRK